jgi:hypothetical protein
VTGLLVAVSGWVAASVGLVLEFGTWTLIPAGVVTCAVGVLVDFEEVTSGKRP